MAPPPAKRQKRNVVLSSDEDVPTPASKLKLPSRISTKQKSTNTKSNGVEKRSLPTRSRTKEPAVPKQPQPAPSHRSPTSSPERAPRKTASKAPVKGTLQSFFKKAREPIPVKEKPKTENAPPAEEEVEEDIIEDDSADEPAGARKTAQVLGSNKSAGRVLDRRKPLQEQTPNGTITASQEKPISASQRFLTAGRTPSIEVATQPKGKDERADTRPWAERYGPEDLSELTVHKKKVADVRGWLEGVLIGQHHQVHMDRLSQNYSADGREETSHTQRSFGCRQDSYRLRSGESHRNRYRGMEEPHRHRLLV